MGWFRRLRRRIAGAVGVVITTVVALFLRAATAEYRPAPHEEVTPVRLGGEATSLRPGCNLRVVSWNVQFCGSRAHHFFYDGGTASRVPRSEVKRTVAEIGGRLCELRPDLVLLQEVDRDSDRTGRLDQLPPLARAIGATSTLTAPYFRVRYLPVPLRRPTGRVDMHLAVLSRRLALQRGARIALPLLAESRLRQAFNLKRALLTAEIPIEGRDLPLAVAVTHLSAFSRGDGTLSRQVEVLERWIAERPPGQPWLLAGDLNLLPPGDDPTRLGPAEAIHYADDPNPIERLYSLAREAFDPPLAPEHRSYLPFAATETDRKIDYVFVGGPIELIDAAIDRTRPYLSDHLPLVVTLRVT